jgi:hypothetical protein
MSIQEPEQPAPEPLEPLQQRPDPEIEAQQAAQSVSLNSQAESVTRSGPGSRVEKAVRNNPGTVAVVALCLAAGIGFVAGRVGKK